MKKLSVLLMTAILLVGSLSAETAEKDSESKVKFATHITVGLTYPWGAQVNVSELIKIPVMNFNNPLTRGNNLAFKIGAEMTPISLEGKFDIIWTPIAFLELYTGITAGSGWSIKKLHGLAMNVNRAGQTVKVPVNFKRAVFSANFGGAFQFDLGAVIPHPWTHIVFRIDQYALYRGMTGVDRYHSWVYKNDGGMNRNGFTYCGTYVLGYQMPIPMNLIAMRVETEKTFYAVPAGLDKSSWGEDRYRVVFGPVLSFKAAKILDIMLAAQWETKHVYTTIDDGKQFYQTKTIDKSKRDTVSFKRIAVIFDIKIPHN